MGSPSGSGTSSTPSNSTAQYYIPQGQPTADTNTQNLLNSFYTQGLNALNYYGQSPYTAYDPSYKSLLSNYVVDPTTGAVPQSATDALTGAKTAAGYGSTLYGMDTANASTLSNYGNTVLNTAFDPQKALYNRGLQQTTDQQNALNAASGVASSPYGAGLAAQNTSNYNIDWQNKQLERQGYGLGAAGKAFTGASDLGYTGATDSAKLAALPYDTGTSIANTGLTGLTDLANYENQAYSLPQTTITDLGNYLKLGQNASLGSGQLGNLGFSQLSSGIGGALSGANSLFGSNGLLSSGSSGSSLGSSLFGSGSDLSSLGGDSIDLGTGAITGSAVSGDAGGGLLSSLGLGTLAS